jgi:hypothetical protein
MAPKVLYAVGTAHEATLPVLERLRAEGCELSFNRTGRTLTEDELIALLPTCSPPSPAASLTPSGCSLRRRSSR